MSLGRFPLMTAPGPILMICTANICRSPMAAALLKHALSAQPEPLKSLEVDSAGVAARGGELVSENSVFVLKKAGIDIAGVQSKALTPALVERASLILCMTEAHRAMIEQTFEPATDKVYLFREFMPAGSETEIADPYGGSVKLYEAARDEMVEAIPSIVAHLKARFRR